MKWTKKRLVIGSIALVYFIVCLINIFLYLNKTELLERHKNRIAKQFAISLQKEEAAVRSFIEKTREYSIDNWKDNYQSLVEYADLHHFNFYYYDQIGPLFWNDAETDLPAYFKEFYRPTFLKINGSRYLVFVTGEEPNNLAICIKLQRHFETNNKYLVDQCELFPSVLEYFEVNSPASDGIKVVLSTGQVVCSLTEIENNEPIQIGLIDGFQLLFFFFTLICIYLIFNNLIKYKSPQLSILIATLAVLLFRYSAFPAVLFDSSWFSPEIYSSSWLGTSFGDLILINIVCFSATAFGYRFLSIGHGSVFWVALLTFLSCAEIHEVGNNSNISISVYNFLELSEFSILFVSLISIKIGLIGLFIKNQKSNLDKSKWVSYAFVLLLFVFFTWQNNWSWYSPLAWIIYLIINENSFINNKWSRLTQQIVYFSLICTLFAVFIRVEITQRQTKENTLLVTDILNTKDQVAEFTLEQNEQSIIDDPYLNQYFLNPLIPKRAIEERIKRLFLAGYLGRFESEMIFSQPQTAYLHPIETNKKLQLESLVGSKGQQISSFFYSINNQQGALEYVGILPITLQSNAIGSIIIHLKEKIVYEESIYPELLTLENPIDVLKSEVSYAVYYQHFIITSHGNLDYPRIHNSDPSVLNKNYRHFISSPNQDTEVIVSFEKISSFQLLASVGLLIILVLLITLILNGLSTVSSHLKQEKLGRKSILFTQKIQYSLLGIAFISFITITIATVGYISDKYGKSTYDKLDYKLDKIRDYIVEEYVGTSNDKSHLDYINESVDKISEFYDTDVDVFNSAGVLVASSQKIIFQKGIISPLMNGLAYNFLQQGKGNELILNESAGELQYLGAYAQVQLHNSELIYLHLAHFRQKKELRKELGDFLITLFNIYLLVALVLAALSYFVSRMLIKPLLYVSQQINDADPDKYNRIHWKRHDEIGDLINAYNQKVDKLREYAEITAENKQEEAWREMARQVAHEIKNPLTPMKLSIQQLERAWKDKHPMIDKMFAKTTHVLISQIESLTRIATEFSTFAKMPSVKPEYFSWTDLLDQFIVLYNQGSQEHVEIIVENEIPKYYGDKEQLFRAVNNLIKNGIQAMESISNGKVLVNIRFNADDQFIHLTVADHGSGIDEQLKDKIFNPNFSTKSSGMGMGLAIVKTIITSHKGQIWFDSQQHIGTKFFIKLPVN